MGVSLSGRVGADRRETKNTHEDRCWHGPVYARPPDRPTPTKPSVDDGKAIDAVRQCKFEPATLDGGAGRPLLNLTVNLLRE